MKEVDQQFTEFFDYAEQWIFNCRFNKDGCQLNKECDNCQYLWISHFETELRKAINSLSDYLNPSDKVHIKRYFKGIALSDYILENINLKGGEKGK